MTTLEDRPGTALLVVDVQDDTDLHWQLQSAPGRTAEVARTADASLGTGATGT